MSRATIVDGRTKGSTEDINTRLHNQWYEDSDGDLFCWIGGDDGYFVIRGDSASDTGLTDILNTPAIRGTLVPVNITITITD